MIIIIIINNTIIVAIAIATDSHLSLQSTQTNRTSDSSDGALLQP
jgi:hypothetical protein